jgi:hypothetical protein
MLHILLEVSTYFLVFVILMPFVVAWIVQGIIKVCRIAWRKYGTFQTGAKQESDNDS